MLTPATPKGMGRCSSVGMYVIPDNGETVVVGVRDASLWPKLYYTVGTVNREGASTVWGDSTQYDTGKHPSVCIVKIKDDLYAIECHSSDVNKMCYYRVGVITICETGGSIAWGDSKQLGCGNKPKISANDGTIVVIMEEICTWSTLKYYIADTRDVNIQKKTIQWTLGAKDDKFFEGLDPDISVNNRDEVVAVCRSYDRRVRAKLGKVGASKKKINWSEATKELPTCGVNPTISFNSNRQIIEIHENIWKELCITCGRFAGNEIHWDNVKDKAVIHNGEYPVVALSDEGVFVEMHSTPFGFSLYYSQGQLVQVRQ